MSCFVSLGSAPLLCVIPSSSVVVQSLSHVQLFMTPGTAGCQASLSCSISQSLCPSY